MQNLFLVNQGKTGKPFGYYAAIRPQADRGMAFHWGCDGCLEKRPHLSPRRPPLITRLGPVHGIQRIALNQFPEYLCEGLRPPEAVEAYHLPVYEKDGSHLHLDRPKVLHIV